MAHRAGPRQRPAGGRRAGPQRNRRRPGRALAPGRARRRHRRLDGLHDPAIVAERVRACRRHTPGRHAHYPDAVRPARPELAQSHKADRPCPRSGARGTTPGAGRSCKGRAAGPVASARSQPEAERRGRAGDDSPPRRRGAHRGGVWRRRAPRVRRPDPPARGAGRGRRQGPRGGDPRPGDRSRRAADSHQRGRGVPRLRYPATSGDPPPEPRPGGSPAGREGARHREHAAEGRSGGRLRTRRRGRAARHHRRAVSGARGVAGRSRHHHHEGRNVNLHEYQARDILRRHGIPVPPGEVATTADEARAIATRLGGGGGGGPVVVKAQVHAGGRGKAGGVKLAANPAEAAAHAAKILGMTIKGLTVRRVLVAPAADIATESYVGIIVDRTSQRPVLMVSAAGGIDIEEVAARTPEQIHRLAVDPRYGLLAHQALGLALKLYRDIAQARTAADTMQRLYTAFYAVGASLAEINPLVTTRDGAVAALDAKIVIDDNELDRRPEIAALRDTSAEAPSEVAAREAGLTFIKLDGTVGCCVNGAGLAMATMDLVKYYGGEPANFLDIGGSSNPQKVVAALRIITGDPSVRAILFNIFGGITRGDDVANGIVQATTALPLEVPIVIRLTGTNEQEGIAILKRAGFAALTDMDEAVKQAVAKANGKAGTA